MAKKFKVMVVPGGKAKDGFDTEEAAHEWARKELRSAYRVVPYACP